jgi:hypothetical protein
VADDRPADTTTDAVAGLQAQVDDLRSTLLARVSRCPTGTIEATLLPAAKADTLILNGATLFRADYPVLWQWVQDNNLVVANAFGAGDGSTTFTLPDFRGLVLSGADATNPLLAKFGSATYTAANLPSHTHTVPAHDPHDHVSFGTNGAGAHHHGINNDGGHGNHGSGGSVLVPDGAFYGVLPGNPQSVGDHSHFGGTGTDGDHTHVVDIQTASAGPHTVGTSGTGASASLRPPSISVNFLIWT